MSSVPLMIESLVAVLLLFTIGYCWKLNRRLEKMRESESAMKGIIAELVTTTEAAERAIANLRHAIGDCDTTLGDRLEQAQQLSVDMSDQLRLGDDILKRIAKIATAVRGVVNAGDAPEVASRAAATATAAEALVNRVRQRQNEAAA